MKALLGGLLALSLLAWFIWPQSLPPVNAAIAALPYISSTDQPWQFNHYKITPQKPFQLEARVLHVKHYSNDRESQLAPVDLALGWDKMADPEVIKRLTFDQSGRWYTYSSHGHPPISQTEMSSCSKNAHMIPSDDGVRATLMHVHEGQTVKITGYLVSAEASDRWSWSGGLSLTGTGNHSCFLVWIDTLDVQ